MKSHPLAVGALGLAVLGLGTWALAERPWDRPAMPLAPSSSGQALANATEPASTSSAGLASRQPAGIPPGWRRDAPYPLYEPPRPIPRTPNRSTRSFHHSPEAEAEAVKVLLDLCRMVKSAKTTKEEFIAYLGQLDPRDDSSPYFLKPYSPYFKEVQFDWLRFGEDRYEPSVSVRLSDVALLSLHTLREHFGAPKEEWGLMQFPPIVFAWRDQPRSDYRCRLTAWLNGDGEDPDDTLDDPVSAEIFNLKGRLRRGVDTKKIWMSAIDIDRDFYD